MLRFALMLSLLATCLPGVVTAEDAETETRTVDAGKIKLTVPKSWKQQQPSNNLRLAQFSVGPAEGDEQPAELVVSGPFGGSVSDNVSRWLAQFDSSDREVTMVQGESEQGKYIWVDMTGTYLKPDGPPILRRTTATPGSRVISVMLQTPNDGNYFLKLAGSEKTVAEAAEALKKSFGGDESTEEPYSL